MSPSSNDGLVQQRKDFKKCVGILQFDAEGERIDEFASLNRFLFYKSVVILFETISKKKYTWVIGHCFYDLMLL